jgi:hypothetical protein
VVFTCRQGLITQLIERGYFLISRLYVELNNQVSLLEPTAFVSMGTFSASFILHRKRKVLFS